MHTQVVKILLFTAPVSPPNDVVVAVPLTTSLTVSWAPLPLEDRRGYILGYIVRVQVPAAGIDDTDTTTATTYTRTGISDNTVSIINVQGVLIFVYFVGQFIHKNEEVYIIVMCNSHLKFSKSLKVYHLENLYAYAWCAYGV